jgi:hypothetical protein
MCSLCLIHPSSLFTNVRVERNSINKTRQYRAGPLSTTTVALNGGGIHAIIYLHVTESALGSFLVPFLGRKAVVVPSSS